jgi:serine/threonine-protein kinase
MIGDLKLISRIGRGGMGAVYKALDSGNNRTVAIKIVSPRLVKDKEFLTRFEREVKAIGSLSHPNIVKSFGSGVFQDRPYLVMEFVDGESLGQVLRTKGPIPEPRVLQIAREIAAGLGHAHEANIIHRDVKPDNVLICTAGILPASPVAKLTDFGLAKLLNEQDLTQTGIAVGTPHYISPEQVADSRLIDRRADLYGLGAVLFQILTGEVPFDAKSNSEIMLKHVEQKARDVRELNPGLSAGTAVVVARLLAKRPCDRYTSAAHLIADLDRLIRDAERTTYPEADLRESQPAQKGGWFSIFTSLWKGQ